MIPTVQVKGKDAGAVMVRQVRGRGLRGIATGLDTASAGLKRSVVEHASGRPGPEIRTGRLVGSVTASATRRRTGSRYEAIVSVSARSDRGAPYPLFLEHGTRKMPAYPFMGPGVAAFRPRYRAIMADAVKSSMRSKA